MADMFFYSGILGTCLGEIIGETDRLENTRE